MNEGITDMTLQCWAAMDGGACWHATAGRANTSDADRMAGQIDRS